MPESRRRTGNSTSFKKGQSGNPGGRPKKTQAERDALEMIKSLAPQAVERLRAIIEDDRIKPEVQLKAIDIILTRTYGNAYAMEQADDALLAAAKKLLEGVESAID